MAQSSASASAAVKVAAVLAMLCVSTSALAAEPAAEPATEGDELDRFGIGATANASMSLIGLPMIGPGVGLTARVRLLDWLLIEPHVEALTECFILIGVGRAQVGVPIIVDAPSDIDSALRTHIGAGPWVSLARFYGHIDGDNPPFTLVGAEVVGGVGLPFNDFIEGRAQLRAHIGFGLPGAVVVGAAGSLGAMLTF